jgi:hypothetical protein
MAYGKMKTPSSKVTVGKRLSNPIKCWDGKKQAPTSKGKGFGSK